MFLFHPIHFLKFLVKSQPQRSYKKGSYTKKECIIDYHAPFDRGLSMSTIEHNYDVWLSCKFHESCDFSQFS